MLVQTAFPAQGNMGIAEQSTDEISSGAEYDSSCPRSDYYTKGMEGTMTAAETRVFWAAQRVPCLPSAAAPADDSARSKSSFIGNFQSCSKLFLQARTA